MLFNPVFLLGIFSALIFQTFIFAISDEESKEKSSHKGKRNAQNEKKSSIKKLRSGPPSLQGLTVSQPRIGFSSPLTSQSFSLDALAGLASTLLETKEIHDEYEEIQQPQALSYLISTEPNASQASFIPAAAETISDPQTSQSMRVNLEETLIKCISTSLEKHFNKQEVENYMFFMKEVILKIIIRNTKKERIASLQNVVRQSLLPQNSHLAEALHNLNLYNLADFSIQWTDDDSEEVLKELQTIISERIISSRLQSCLNQLRHEFYKSKLLSCPLIPLEEKSALTTVLKDDLIQPVFILDDLAPNCSSVPEKSVKSEIKKIELAVNPKGVRNLTAFAHFVKYTHYIDTHRNSNFEIKLKNLDVRMHSDSLVSSKSKNRIIEKFFKLADLSELESLYLDIKNIEDKTIMALDMALKKTPCLKYIIIKVENTSPLFEQVIKATLPNLKELKSFYFFHSKTNTEIKYPLFEK